MFLTNEQARFNKTKEIKEKITIKSSIQEVNTFLEKSFNFKGKNNTINGEKLFLLDNEGMNKLGFNLGQKKKLIKYINYFKNLPIEDNAEKEFEEEEIIIHKNSTKEEVSKFLRKNSKLSQEIIDDLGFDAKSLLEITNEEIDDLTQLKKEEKESLKKSLKKNKENLI